MPRAGNKASVVTAGDYRLNLSGHSGGKSYATDGVGSDDNGSALKSMVMSTFEKVFDEDVHI
jgi:hypothetical protein